MIHIVLDKLVNRAIKLGEIRNKQNLPLDRKLADDLDIQEEKLINQIEVLRECIIEYIWNNTQN